MENILFCMQDFPMYIKNVLIHIFYEKTSYISALNHDLWATLH